VPIRQRSAHARKRGALSYARRAAHLQDKLPQSALHTAGPPRETPVASERVPHRASSLPQSPINLPPVKQILRIKRRADARIRAPREIDRDDPRASARLSRVFIVGNSRGIIKVRDSRSRRVLVQRPLFSAGCDPSIPNDRAIGLAYF